MNFKFVTAGQHPDDAQIISFTLRGNSLKPATMSDPIVSFNTNVDLVATATGNPNAHEEPADYNMEIWLDDDFTDLGNLVRTIPMKTLTSSPVTLAVAGGCIESGDTVQSDYSSDNNFGGGLGDSAVTVQQLTDNLMSVEFTLQSTEADGTLDLTGADRTGVDLDDVGLSDPSYTTAGLNFSVRWLAGTLPGTVKEQIHFASVLISERDNVDPGYSALDGTVKRSGPRYLMAFNGTRYEVYVNFRPNTGQEPVASVAMPSSGPAVPVRAILEAGLGVNILDVRMGGFAKNRVSAAYRTAEQTEDVITPPYYVSMYQVPRYPLVPVNRLNVLIDPI